MVLKTKHKKALRELDAFLAETTEECVLTAAANDKPDIKKPIRSHKGQTTEYLRNFVETDITTGKPRWGILLGPEIMAIDFDDPDKYNEYAELFPDDIHSCPAQTTKKGKHCFFLNTHGFKGSSIKFDDAVDLLVQESSDTRRYIEVYPSANKRWERTFAEAPLQPMSDALHAHITKFVQPVEVEPELVDHERTYLEFDDLQRFVLSLNPASFEKYGAWLDLLFVVKNQVPPGASKSVGNKYYALLVNFCDKMSNFDETELEEKWENHLSGDSGKKYGIPKLKELVAKYSLDKKKANAILEELGDKLDDASAAKLFLDLEPEIVFRFNKDFFVYDKDSGLWCDNGRDINMLSKYAMEHSDHLQDYGRKTSKINNMLTLVRSLVPQKYDLFEMFDTASHGFIQFRDVVYDMNTRECHPLSSEYFSLRNTGRNFVPRTHVPKAAFDAVKKAINDTLPEEVAKYLYRLIGYAMYGDNADRRFVFCIGDTGAGKGILQMFLKGGFGNYISIVNASMYQKKTTNDTNGPTPEPRKLQCCRIALSQEAEMGRSFDGNVIKIHAGGGDVVPCRGLREDPREIRVQCLHVHLANDTPSIDPADDAVRDRVRYIPFNRQFVDPRDPKFDPELHRVRDNKLKQKIDDKKTFMAEAFFWLCMDGYLEYKTNGNNLAEPKPVMDETEAYFASEQTWENVLMERYEVTKNADDKVKLQDIENHLKDKSDISRRKLRRLLPKTFKVKEVSGNPIYFSHLRVRDSDEDF